MNASRAKKIRKQIYGNLSRRITQYSIWEHIKKFFGRNELTRIFGEHKKGTVQLICRGLRADYKKAKRAWKERLRNGTG